MKILCLLFILITMPLLSQEAKITISVVDENNQPVLNFKADIMDTNNNSFFIQPVDLINGKCTFLIHKNVKFINFKIIGSGYFRTFQLQVIDTNLTMNALSKIDNNYTPNNRTVVDSNLIVRVDSIVKIKKDYIVLGSIEGTVTDIDDKPVVGACVRIVGTRLGGFVKSDGKFKVNSIPPGKYAIRLTAVGFKNFDCEINVKNNEICKLSVKMDFDKNVNLSCTGLPIKSLINHNQIGTIHTYDASTSPWLFK